jgi:hypothetical protein
MDTIKIEFPINYVRPFDQASAIKYMMEGMTKLIKFGAIKGNLDDIIVNYEIHNPGGYAIAEIKKEALVDGSKLQSTGASMTYPFHKDDFKIDSVKLDSTQRQFSTATIQERLKISKLDPKIKFRLTVRDYQKFWKSNSSKMDKSTALKLRNMFLMDTMGIITEVLPLIGEGKMISQLTGLNSVTKDMNNVARELSTAYRKAIKQSKTGSLSKSVLQPLQQKYNEFVNLLVPQVFVGFNDIIGTKSYSLTSDGRIRLFS